MFIHAKNGNVFEVHDDQADALVSQGHLAFEKVEDARKAKTPKDKAPAESEADES